jgi:hypothetical protein
MKAHAWYFPHGYDTRWQRMATVLEYSCRKQGLDIEMHKMEVPRNLESDYKVVSNHSKLKLWNEVVQSATEPVLLLDADMFCQRNPIELVQTVEHIGITWRPRNQSIPINAGFVFVQPTPEAKAFFNRWCELDDYLRANGGIHYKWRQKYAGMNQSSLGMLIETESPPITRLECTNYNLVEQWDGLESAAFIHVKSKAQWHVFCNTKTDNPNLPELKRRFLDLEKELMETISPEYAELNAQLHKSFERYGCNSARHLERIEKLMKEAGCHSVLDYGCGKGGLVKALEGKHIPVQGYDPAMEEYSDAPKPADMVVCTDVLEHIEPEKLDAVLADLNRLTLKTAFLLIALRYDSTKTLPDGTNPHKIVESLDWWVAKLRVVFGYDAVKVTAYRKDHHTIIHILKN